MQGSLNMETPQDKAINLMQTTPTANKRIDMAPSLPGSGKGMRPSPSQSVIDARKTGGTPSSKFGSAQNLLL